MCTSRHSAALTALVAVACGCIPGTAFAAEVGGDETARLALAEGAALVALGTALLILVVWHVRRGALRHEAVLQAANDRQRAIIDAIPDALFRMDGEGRFTEFKCSPDFEVALPPESFLGKSIRETPLPAGLVIDWESAVEAVRRDGGYRVLEYQLDYPEGPHDFEARIVQLGPDEFLAIVRDISARKQAEADSAAYRRQLELTVTKRTSDLMEANIRLQEANRAKSAFLANVSHELRTPLNSVIGFTDVMLTGLPGDLNDEQRHQLTMVRGAGKELLSLVEDVLDYTRIESGRVTALPAEFRLPNMLAGCVARVRTNAEIRGLALELDLEDAPATIETDQRLLEQIVLNLLSNAIKFTAKGSVTLHASRTDDTHVTVQVVDTGCGIDPSLMADIFRAFEQGGDSRETRPQGLGLGLAICHELAELLGGTISLESERGRGTTASLLLPLKPTGHDSGNGTGAAGD